MQAATEPKYEIHPENLTETERVIIANVLARDEEIRRQERLRLRELKTELDDLRERSVKQSDVETAGRVCLRCQTPLGLIFNSGALCPSCAKRVCKDCRANRDGTEEWECTYCSKVREIKSESGVWFYDHNQPKQKRNLYGTALLMRLFKKAPRKEVQDLLDPIWSDFDEGESGFETDDEKDRVYVMLTTRDDGEIDVTEGNGAALHQHITNAEANVVGQRSESLADNDVKEARQSGQPEKLNLLAMATSGSLHAEESLDVDDAEMEAGVNQSVPSIQVIDTDRHVSSGESSDASGHHPSPHDNTRSVDESDEGSLSEDRDSSSSSGGGGKQAEADIIQEREGQPDNVTMSRDEEMEEEAEDEEDIDAYFDDFTKPEAQEDTIDTELGELFLDLTYSRADHKFEVQVYKARDLKIADQSKHTTDPYVKLYLLPDASKHGKRKTKIKKHTQNPDYEETLAYTIDEAELLFATLSCSVWHKDSLGKNVFLGEVDILLNSYRESGFSLESASPKWYPLTEKKISRSDLTYAGELVIRVSFQYSTSSSTLREGVLSVQLVEGSNLMSVESDGTSSPYCKLRLLPDKLRRESSVFPKSVFPIWNEVFDFNCILFKDLYSKALEISVYDGNQHKFLGCLRLSCGECKQDVDDSFGDEVDAWNTMLSEPHTGGTFTIPLRSSLACIRSLSGPLPSSMSSSKEKKVGDAQKKARSPSTTSVGGVYGKHLAGVQSDQHSLTSYGSMTSVYSSAGGHHHIPITGEMLFAIRYDNIAGIFEVVLKKAKDIAAASTKTHTSDPYIKTYLLPDKSKKSKKKSLVKKKSLNPEWNETIKYKIKQDELMKRTLQISVWNNERFGHNDFLGEVQVQIADYVNGGHDLDVAEGIWYTLQEMAPVRVSSPGTQANLTVGLKFAPTGDDWGKLIVDIKTTEHLTGDDDDTTPSAFVKCYLLPDKSRKAKRKTSVKKKVPPVWNDKIEYDNVSLDELRYRVLEVTVWDHDVRGHSFLGGCRLGLQQGDEPWHDCADVEVRVWDAMLQHSNIWSEFDIPLRGTMKSNREEQRLQSGTEKTVPMVEKSMPASYRSNEARMLSMDASVTPLLPGQAVIIVGLHFFSENIAFSDAKKKEKGALQIHLQEARYLKSIASGDFPDSFCKCILHSKKKSAKQQSKVFKKSNQPVWDEKLSFPGVSAEGLRNKVLEVNIIDEVGSKGKGKGLLGSIHLGLGEQVLSYDDATGREVDLWKDMTNRHNEWVYATLPLRVPTTATSQDDSESDLHFEGKIDDAAHQDQDASGRESPRTLALRAMGSHASEVINIMEQNSTAASTGPQLIAHYHNDPDDAHASLGTIEEESDIERSGSVSRPSSQASSGVVSPVTASTRLPTAVVPLSRPPSITVTPEPVSVVQPGDPPFPSSASRMSWAEEEESSQTKFKKQKISKSKLFGSTDSLASQTSESLAIYGRVIVCGSVQFAMRYDFNSTEFEVHAYSAKDIAIADMKKMTSDPYFKVALFPDAGRNFGKKKTKVVKGSVNPEWDEIMKFKIKFRELSVKTLIASVWNHDRFGRNEFLGEARVMMNEVVRESGLVSPIVKWYPLEEKQVIQPYMVCEGTLIISLKFDEEKSKKESTKKRASKKKAGSKLSILIQSGKDLPARDSNGMSDPYCKCYLLPDRPSKSKRKTAVIKRTVNPSWDFTIEYDFRAEDFQDMGLELSVWDWDLGSHNDFIGCARLGLGLRRGDWDDAEGVEVDIWNKAMRQPGMWHDASLPLRGIIEPRGPKTDD